jgi:uncharacterized membrane protein
VTSLLIEWFNLLARWAHIIAAIMWIGDSLLFMWIDSHLAPDPQSRRDVTGVAWLIHGGGYYHLEKRLLVPGRLPPSLRWFWLEATGTWVSGALLLILVYYMSADAFMVDRGVSSLTPGQAIAVGLGLLAGGWVLYDGLWRTRLSRWPLAALTVSGALLTGVIYGATHTLSGRAAFIHVGAMLGTIMVANVWVHILPSQHRMVQAAREGREIDYSLGVHAKTRSTHNTYLTYPVIFLMISQHFPVVYTGSLNWVTLALFIVFGAGARQITLVGIRPARGAAVVTLLALLLLVYLTARPGGVVAPRTSAPSRATAPAPAVAEVRAVIVQRCAVCHSETPSMPGITAAPNGVKLDTPQQIKALAALIKVRAVDLRTMPPGNITHITDQERALLGRWVEEGAPLR